MDYSTDAVLMTEEELSLYLKKLGLTEKPANDLAGLTAVQYAHLTHIPYENLDSLQKKVTSLNRHELFRKIILQQRGGICFELNGLYAWLLSALGFTYKNHAARYIFDDDVYQMRRRRVMTVTLGGGRYLTDVGVNSECSRVPLLLTEDTVQTDGVSEYRFTKDPFWGWLLWQRLSGHDWKRLYGFTEEPQEDMDYVMPCIYCDLHPTSPMNKYEKISVFTEDANIRIWSGNYQVFRRGVRETDESVNEDRKKALLREVFGIVLPMVQPNRTTYSPLHQ